MVWGKCCTHSILHHETYDHLWLILPQIPRKLYEQREYEVCEKTFTNKEKMIKDKKKSKDESLRVTKRC